jgi:hypothetical protein
LPEDVDVPFEDVSAFVVFFVEGRWSAAGGPTSFAVADLIGRVLDDSHDATVAKVGRIALDE